MNEKLTEIDESYVNGQLKQFIKQVRQYGQRKFFVDFYDYLEHNSATNYDFDKYYAMVTYKFFKYKDALL